MENKRLICSVCHSEGDEVDEIVPSFTCRKCNDGKSALDGKSREEITANRFLSQVRYDRTNTKEEYLQNQRRPSRRASSKRYRDSVRGRKRRAERALEKDGVRFSLEEWNAYIAEVFKGCCAHCLQPTVRLIRVCKGKRLAQNLPMCRRCQTRAAAFRRWNR
jgi:hypothetical protein